MLFGSCFALVLASLWLLLRFNAFLKVDKVDSKAESTQLIDNGSCQSK